MASGRLAIGVCCCRGNFGGETGIDGLSGLSGGGIEMTSGVTASVGAGFWRLL